MLSYSVSEFRRDFSAKVAEKEASHDADIALYYKTLFDGITPWVDSCLRYMAGVGIEVSKSQYFSGFSVDDMQFSYVYDDVRYINAMYKVSDGGITIKPAVRPCKFNYSHESEDFIKEHEYEFKCYEYLKTEISPVLGNLGYKVHIDTDYDSDYDDIFAEYVYIQHPNTF